MNEVSNARTYFPSMTCAARGLPCQFMTLERETSPCLSTYIAHSMSEQKYEGYHHNKGEILSRLDGTCLMVWYPRDDGRDGPCVERKDPGSSVEHPLYPVRALQNLSSTTPSKQYLFELEY